MLLLYSYQMIFSVKWHFTCAANCDVTLHKIASEHTTARGGPAKFWATFSSFSLYKWKYIC